MNSGLKLIPLPALTNTLDLIRNELSYNSIEDAFCPNVLFFPLDGRPLCLKFLVTERMYSLPNIEQSKPYELSTLLI